MPRENKERKNMKKITMMVAVAAAIAGIGTGCKSIEVTRKAQTLVTWTDTNGVVHAVCDTSGKPVILDGGWEADYFQHWNWQKFDMLRVMAGKDVSLEINKYEGGADATNLTQLVHTSLEGLTKLIATVADAYVKVAGGGAQADTAIKVAKQAVGYFNSKGGDISKATVSTDSETGTIKISDGTTCIECDKDGNCKDGSCSDGACTDGACAP